jgi:hypothetical protein
MSAELYNLTTRKNIGSAKDLLQSLVPRAQSFCFYDPSRARIWSSEAVDDFEVDNYICDLPDEIIAGEDSNSELLRKTLSSGRTLLILPVYNDTNVGLGLLVCVFSMNAGKSSSFNPSLLVNILKPALQIIGEVMNSGARLSAVQDRVKTAEKELTVIYQIDEKIHGSSKSHSSLAQLTGQSGRFLGISYSVLLLRDAAAQTRRATCAGDFRRSSGRGRGQRVRERFPGDGLPAPGPERQRRGCTGATGSCQSQAIRHDTHAFHVTHSPQSGICHRTIVRQHDRPDEP